MGGKCVAILPCGMDNIYPSANKQHVEEIIEKGGCLISEYEPGGRPEK